MKNTIYRIRNKKTGQYINLGYNNKSVWQHYPTQVIINNRDRLSPIENFEVVVCEYKEISCSDINI